MQQLKEGTRVRGWQDGTTYTGTVVYVSPPKAGLPYQGVLVQKDDGGEADTFSDAVQVLEG